jgi:hypothetical protein
MEADEFTRWDAVTMNLEMLNWWIVGIVAVVMLVFKLVKYRSFNYKKAILFLIIALMPYVWYFILSNHSYLHWWFTFRLQAVTIACLMMIMADSRQQYI